MPRLSQNAMGSVRFGKSSVEVDEVTSSFVTIKQAGTPKTGSSGPFTIETEVVLNLDPDNLDNFNIDVTSECETDVSFSVVNKDDGSITLSVSVSYSNCPSGENPGGDVKITSNTEKPAEPPTVKKTDGKTGVTCSSSDNLKDSSCTTICDGCEQTTSFDISSIILPNRCIPAGDSFQIPLLPREDDTIAAYDTAFEFDPNKLQFDGTSTAPNFPQPDVTTSTGRVELSASGGSLTPRDFRFKEADETLVYLNFTVVGSTGKVAELVFDKSFTDYRNPDGESIGPRGFSDGRIEFNPGIRLPGFFTRTHNPNIGEVQSDHAVTREVTMNTGVKVEEYDIIISGIEGYVSINSTNGIDLNDPTVTDVDNGVRFQASTGAPVEDPTLFEMTLFPEKPGASEINFEKLDITDNNGNSINLKCNSTGFGEVDQTNRYGSPGIASKGGCITGGDVIKVPVRPFGEIRMDDLNIRMTYDSTVIQFNRFEAGDNSNSPTVNNPSGGVVTLSDSGAFSNPRWFQGYNAETLHFGFFYFDVVGSSGDSTSISFDQSNTTYKFDTVEVGPRRFNGASVEVNTGITIGGEGTKFPPNCSTEAAKEEIEADIPVDIASQSNVGFYKIVFTHPKSVTLTDVVGVDLPDPVIDKTETNGSVEVTIQASTSNAVANPRVCSLKFQPERPVDFPTVPNLVFQSAEVEDGMGSEIAIGCNSNGRVYFPEAQIQPEQGCTSELGAFGFPIVFNNTFEVTGVDTEDLKDITADVISNSNPQDLGESDDFPKQEGLTTVKEEFQQIPAPNRENVARLNVTFTIFKNTVNQLNPIDFKVVLKLDFVGSLVKETTKIMGVSKADIVRGAALGGGAINTDAVNNVRFINPSNSNNNP